MKEKERETDSSLKFINRSFFCNLITPVEDLIKFMREYPISSYASRNLICIDVSVSLLGRRESFWCLTTAKFSKTLPRYSRYNSRKIFIFPPPFFSSLRRVRGFQVSQAASLVAKLAINDTSREAFRVPRSDWISSPSFPVRVSVRDTFDLHFVDHYPSSVTPCSDDRETRNFLKLVTVLLSVAIVTRDVVSFEKPVRNDASP